MWRGAVWCLRVKIDDGADGPPTDRSTAVRFNYLLYIVVKLRSPHSCKIILQSDRMMDAQEELFKQRNTTNYPRTLVLDIACKVHDSTAPSGQPRASCGGPAHVLVNSDKFFPASNFGITSLVQLIP